MRLDDTELTAERVSAVSSVQSIGLAVPSTPTPEARSSKDRKPVGGRSKKHPGRRGENNEEGKQKDDLHI